MKSSNKLIPPRLGCNLLSVKQRLTYMKKLLKVRLYSLKEHRAPILILIMEHILSLRHQIQLLEAPVLDQVYPQGKLIMLLAWQKHIQLESDQVLSLLKTRSFLIECMEWEENLEQQLAEKDDVVGSMQF